LYLGAPAGCKPTGRTPRIAPTGKQNRCGPGALDPALRHAGVTHAQLAAHRNFD
jgi:hypothetical protein